MTHGGPSNTAIDEKLDRLKEYIDNAVGRIIILPGCGITNTPVLLPSTTALFMATYPLTYWSTKHKTTDHAPFLD